MEGLQARGNSDMEDGDFFEDEGEGIKIEETIYGGYECPSFVLSRKEEERIHKPWKNGLIVQLLGRKIGFKPLETRLKQLWVRQGVINIVDLGYDYFLVTFTSEEDHTTAQVGGPWLIYDHYLAVREWSADFNPAVESVKSIAVWFRFSGLPIEYYDAKLLHVIGDRIGRSVKVDKTTLYQEHGKYARLCVEVDLTKPLLAMFTIKGRHYKVEYEGLHFLCLNCGIFGHYVEGCPKRSTESSKSGENQGSETAKRGEHGQQPMVERPWTVVQKQRLPRKSKDHSNNNGGVNKEPNSKGSRFAILGNEAINMETNEHVTNLGETNGKEQLLKRNIMTIHVEIQGNILVEHSQIRSIISVASLEKHMETRRSTHH
ncbi:zinc ion binding / nucleic acid binding protein [Trifolium repens]|nr:zinc ion binding / nucleic acid binding protein [Trifolium repens]